MLQKLWYSVLNIVYNIPVGPISFSDHNHYPIKKIRARRLIDIFVSGEPAIG
jgi:hypothetical protein